jgi:hypothetical protein
MSMASTLLNDALSSTSILNKDDLSCTEDVNHSARDRSRFVGHTKVGGLPSASKCPSRSRIAGNNLGSRLVADPARSQRLWVPRSSE